MIDISNALPTVLTKLKTLSPGHYIELLTYKKDRSIKMVKISESELLVVEKGFVTQEVSIDPKKLKKILKSLIKREFPRSNKAHLHSGKSISNS